MPPGRHARAA